MTYDYDFRDTWNAEAAAKQRAPAIRSLSLAIERPGTYWISLEYRSDLARSARLDTFIDQEPSRPGAIRVVCRTPDALPRSNVSATGATNWMSDEQGNWRGTTAARLDLTPGTYRVSTTLREQGVRIAWGPQPDRLKGSAPLFWTIGLSGSGALIGAWGLIARRRAARLIAGN
ncbi:hypothetical protein ACFQ61_28290 [Streptomyces sp. NPDC056500]|uniref:hypothetical protein n=1 Tax=Streptomyces sp. NPDC056500 TaxID=3345840 RepID=UPI0036C91A2A